MSRSGRKPAWAISVRGWCYNGENSFNLSGCIRLLEKEKEMALSRSEMSPLFLVGWMLSCGHKFRWPPQVIKIAMLLLPLLFFHSRMLKMACQDFIFFPLVSLHRITQLPKHKRHRVSSEPKISGLCGFLLWQFWTLKFWCQSYSFGGIACSLVLGVLVSLPSALCMFGFPLGSAWC